MTDEPTYKIVVVGESGVGKSCVISRYWKNEFSEDIEPTIGVEFATKDLEHDGTIIHAQLWDTAGQERFRAIAAAYYRGARGAIIVYDVTAAESLEKVGTWKREIEDNGDENCVIMLMGNKCDLEDDRAIAYDQGENYADENKFLFYETSAKEGTNVTQAFEKIIRNIYDKEHRKGGSGSKKVVKGKDNIRITEGGISGKSGCPCG